MHTDQQSASRAQFGQTGFETESRSDEGEALFAGAQFKFNQQKPPPPPPNHHEATSDEVEEEEIRRFTEAQPAARSASVEHFMDDATPQRRGRKRKKDATEPGEQRFASRAELTLAVRNARCGDTHHQEGEAGEDDESSCEELERKLELMFQRRRQSRQRALGNHKRRRRNAELSSMDSASAAHFGADRFDRALDESGVSLDEDGTEASNVCLPTDKILRQAWLSSDIGRVKGCFWCGWGRKSVTRVSNEYMQELGRLLHEDPSAPVRIRARRAHEFFKKFIWTEALMRGQYLPIWRTKQIENCLLNHRNDPRLVLAEQLRLVNENVALLSTCRAFVDAKGRVVPNVGAMKEMSSQIKNYWALSERQMEKQVFYDPDTRIRLADSEYKVATVALDHRVGQMPNGVLEVD